MVVNLNKFPGFSSERLVLRDFRKEDLVAFTEYRNDPEVARYQSWQDYDMERAQLFYVGQMAQLFGQLGSWYQIAICDKASDKILGDCVIHFIDEQQVEVGFTLAANNQRKGYATEAMKRLLAFIFNDLGKHRVTAVIDVLNQGSIRLLDSTGFRREAHFVENIFFKGSWGSEYQYAILAREFKAAVKE